MLLGGAIYANIVSTVTNSIINLDQPSNDYKRSMDNLLRFIKQQHIPSHLAVRLKQYFIRCRSLHEMHYHQDTMMRMSPDLRGYVAQYCNMNWIMKIPFLRSTEKERGSFITDVCVKLEMTSFPASENVIHFGECNSRMYLVRHGIAMSSRDKATINGGFFGEDMVTSLITSPKPRDYSVSTLTFCDLYYLSVHALEHILHQGLYYDTNKIIRRAAFKLMFRKYFSTFVYEERKWLESEELQKSLRHEKQTKLFLSYGRGEATKFVLWIKDQLIRRGFDVWMDSEQIKSGSDWQHAIAEAVLTCDGMITVLDNKYKNSTYCKDEMSLAKSENKPIFPILFRGATFTSLPSEMRFMLASVNAVSFSNKQHDEEQLRALVDDMSKVLASIREERTTPEGSLASKEPESAAQGWFTPGDHHHQQQQQPFEQSRIYAATDDEDLY
jgi:hypothetical protein